MPLYEYRCNACGHQFEKIQSFSAPEEKVCPVCGGTVERLISAPAVQFKGSGWYVTDYASKGSGSKRSENKGGADSGSKESSGKDSGGGSSSEPAKSSGGDSTSSTPAPSPTPKKD